MTAPRSESRERFGKVLFIKLIRILPVVLAIGVICRLFYSAGKKSESTRRRRKFVKSSVIEKKDETSESGKENS